MSAARFRVVISSLRASDLLAKDASGTSDPYLKINFDNYKQLKTNVVKKTLHPVWDDRFEFDYSTRYPDRLGRKEVKIECFDHDFWGRDDPIGTVTLDLHSLATGPTHQKLTLRDNHGGNAGVVEMDFEFQEVRQVTIEVRNLTVTGTDVHRQSFIELVTYNCNDSSATPKRYTPTKGKNTLATLEGVRTLLSLSTLASSESGLQLGLRKSNSNLHEWRVPFGSLALADDKPITVEATSPGGASLRAEVILSNLPTFGQMVGGFNTENGPAGGTLVHPLAEKPARMGGAAAPPAPVVGGGAAAVPMGGASAGAYPGAYPGYPARPAAGGGASGPRRLAGAAHVAGVASSFAAMRMGSGYGAVGAPPVPPSPMGGAGAAGAGYPAPPFPASPHAGRAAPPYPGAPGAAMGAGMAAAAAMGASRPPPPPPAPSSRGGGAGMDPSEEAAIVAAQVLPDDWQRCLTDDGRVYYRNHMYKYTVWKLPTEREYEVTFADPGPLGMVLETNWSGMERFGRSSGRRASGVDLGAVVEMVEPSGQAARAGRGNIQPGHHIIAVNGTSVLDRNYEQTLEAITSAGRPLTLRFQDPSAVSRDVAEAIAAAERKGSGGSSQAATAAIGRSALQAALGAGPSPAPAPAPAPAAPYGGAASGGYPSAYGGSAGYPAAPATRPAPAPGYPSGPSAAAPGYPAPSSRPAAPGYPGASPYGAAPSPYGAAPAPYGGAPAAPYPGAAPANPYGGAPAAPYPGAARAPYPGAGGWQQAMDPRSGRTYYYNPATGETRW